jgi:hypothetical protein
MSSRPQFNPYPVITNGDMTTNLTSKVTVVQKLSLVSYSCSWVGISPVGTVEVQVSNDYSQHEDGTVKNPGTWNTLPLSAPTGVSGNTGNGFIDLDANAGYAMRLIYLAGSGTGLLNVIVTAKVA